MSGQDRSIQELYEKYGDDISRLAQDVQNAYSFSKVSFIYARLKRLGPWEPADITMELILELDMMQAALAVEYARIFVSGSRKVNREKVPENLRPVHDEIMMLRNKRYAHDDNHESVENAVHIQIIDSQVVVKPSAKITMCLGAPPEWEKLIDWLGLYLFDQTEKQLQRLTEMTGLKWVQPMDTPPDWL